MVSKEIDSKPFFDALNRIISDAYRFAKAGQSSSGIGPVTALDIVEFTVRLLEDDPLFNAGDEGQVTRGGLILSRETMKASETYAMYHLFNHNYELLCVRPK